ASGTAAYAHSLARRRDSRCAVAFPRTSSSVCLTCAAAGVSGYFCTTSSPREAARSQLWLERICSYSASSFRAAAGFGAAAGFTGCAGAAGGGALEEQAATAALRNRQNARRRFMSVIADTRQEGNDNRSAAVAARSSPDSPARIVAEIALVG